MTIYLQQDFESGSSGFSTPGGYDPFARVSNFAHAGTYAFFATNENTLQTARTEFTVVLSEEATLTYWHRANQPADGIAAGHKLYVDDVLEHTRQVTTFQDWTQETVTLSAGTRKVTFESIHDESGTSNYGVWIDDVLVESASSTVSIIVASDSAVEVVARRADGTGPLYRGEVISDDAGVYVPKAEPAESIDYLVTARRKNGGEYTEFGSQVVTVEQSDVVSNFLAPTGETGSITVNADPGVEVMAMPIDAGIYFVERKEATVSGGGSAALSLPKASEVGESAIRYLVTARKRNDVDSTVLDWVSHAVVAVEESSVSVTIESPE